MHVICVCQNKGGDGKTTLSRLILEWAARQSMKALAIDLDPQCNLSARVLGMDGNAEDPDGMLPPLHPSFDPDDPDGWDGRSSVADFFNGKSNAYGSVPYETRNPQIDILPGHGQSLREVDKISAKDTQERVVDRLRQVIWSPELVSLYDLVVIDTPPTKGRLVEAALRSATHIVVPCQMAQNSVDGLRGMLQYWRRENRSRQRGQELELIGVVPNRYKQVAVQQGLHEWLRNADGLGEYLIPHLLTERTAFAEVDHPNAKPRSVFDLPSRHPARKEAESLCRYIFDRAGLAVGATAKTRKAKESTWAA